MIMDKQYEHLANSISKDKIKAKIGEIDKEYYDVLSNKNRTLMEQNYNAQRHEAMKMVLQELLEE